MMSREDYERDMPCRGVCGESTVSSGSYLKRCTLLRLLTCCRRRSTEAFGFKKQARRPKIDKLWREPDFPLRRPDCIGYWWYPYPMSIKSQPWMQVEIRELDALLSELVEEALDFLHPESHESSPLENPARALQLYDAFT